ARPDRRAQPVDRVVGHLDGFGDVLVGNDRQHRAEDLLLRQAAVISHVGEDRRLDEGRAFEAGHTRGPPARRHRRALGFAYLDIALPRLTLLLGDQRPQIGLEIKRVTHAYAARTCDQPLDKLVVQRRGNETARAGFAALAAVEEHAEQYAVGCQPEIGVGQYQARRFATQLQRHTLDSLAGSLHHPPANLGRAGQSDLIHARMACDRLADLAARTCYQVDYAARQ